MRRLPPWMLGGASAGETAARNNCSEPEAPKPKAEKRPKRSQKPKEKESSLSSEEPKRVRRKIREEAKHSNDPEMIPSVTGSVDEDLTVDDLLSFAHEYVQNNDDQTGKEAESLSMSESVLVTDESNVASSSSQGGTRDPATEEMLGLLLGPFFKKH